MKKIFATILVLGFLLGYSGFALAQDDLNECCRINQTFKYGSTDAEKVSSGDIIGRAADVTCVISGSQQAVTANDKWGLICMLNTIYTVTNWVFYILTLLAVLFIIYGGFTVLTASGDPTKSTKGKNILTYAIIGLAIALVATIIPSLARFILGM